ncbi:MAG: SCO1664 family protein [Anaerolineales bacterium]|nr:SCO1664 family protein [Anaerolineales bacterium]
MTASTPPPRPVSLDTLLILLQEGKLEVEGLLPHGSNYTFLATLTRGNLRTLAVYKPTRGEQPLWDFPEETLAYREVAAYLTSEALGWDFVPPTVHRADGPHGAGSVQYFIQAQPDCHYFTFSNDEKAELPRVALFDLLVNNADRKGGHILRDTGGKLWLIDHGICFNAQPKLRTVVWDFGGQAIPPELLKDMADFRQRLDSDTGLLEAYRDLLAANEIAALRRRADKLLSTRKFPEPGPGRNYPWPPL